MCFRCIADFPFRADRMNKVPAKYHSQKLTFPDRCFDRYNDLYQSKKAFELRLPVCKSISFINEKDKCNEPIILSSEYRQFSVHIAKKVLTNDFGLTELSSTTSKKIKKIELNYKNGMEEFWITQSEWLKMRRNIIQELQRKEQRFRLIHRTTASITFISSTVELVSKLDFLKNTINLKMGLPFINLVLTGISLTSSILALSYSRSILEDIARELREDKKQKEDLERVYKRGEWVDKAVQDLFPFGIDSNLLEDPVLSQQDWRYTLCSAIILTNIKKDKTILNDQDFLPTVKAFVDSPAAQIWINRMKLRKMLNITPYKYENISDKEIVTSSTDVFLNRAAINLYPVLSPLLTKSGHTEKMRFLFSSIAAVITALDLVDNGHDEFHEMKVTILELKEEYGRIRKINNSLISDYD